MIKNKRGMDELHTGNMELHRHCPVSSLPGVESWTVQMSIPHPCMTNSHLQGPPVSSML